MEALSNRLIQDLRELPVSVVAAVDGRCAGAKPQVLDGLGNRMAKWRLPDEVCTSMPCRTRRLASC